MKKFLAVIGSFALFGSTATSVVACTNNEVTNETTDNDKYDNSEEVKGITQNAVDRMKSIVLADQFQLNDEINWGQIVDYDKTNTYTELFDEASVKNSEKYGLNINGEGGKSNILAHQILDGLVNLLGGVGIGDINLKSIIDGLNLGDYIDEFGEAVTLLPKEITNMSLKQLVSLIPGVLKALSGVVMGFIGDLSGDTLNWAAESISTALWSALKNFRINDFIDVLIHETSFDAYKDFTFKELSLRMWMSLFTTIGYAVDSSYVSNPETELGPKNAKRLADKFKVAISSPEEGKEKETILPIEGEKREFLGVVKYAVSTIKMFEIYLQFFGEEFFTYKPDVNDWDPNFGNTHLLSKDQTNVEYFDSKRTVKAETLTQVKPGINFAFIFKVLQTFIGNPTDKENGVMFQKFLNALLTDYFVDDGENKIEIPVVKEILSHLLPEIPIIDLREVINESIIPQLQGVFTNKPIPGTLETFLDIILLMNQVPASFRPMIKSIRDFLVSNPIGTNFKRKAFDYVWTQEISLILPKFLSPIKDKLNIETFSLQNVLYKARLIDVISLFGADINKYGSKYTQLSISALINKLDSYINAESITYQDLNKENFDLAKIPNILKILLEENPIKLTAEEDDGLAPIKDHSFVRQLISNLKNAKDTTIFQKILGIETAEVEGQEKPNVEVLKNSLIGAIIEFIFPTLTASSEDKYTSDDLTNVSGFNRNFLTAIGDLLTTLLEKRDYTFLIQPLVMDDKVWKLKDIRNIYFENSNGKLLYQKFSLEFDPTNAVLNDGIKVGSDKKAVYEVIFRRTDPDQKFFFQQIIKQRVEKQDKDKG